MKRILDARVAVLVLGISLSGCGPSGVETTAEEFVAPISEEPGVGDPTPRDPIFADKSNAIGFYSNGTIEAATKFPDASSGIIKIFRLRDRAYATATLVRTLTLAASAWRAEFPAGDRVQIGDIADSDGGSISGHASHQNGLDVDVAYLRTDRIERNPNTNGPNGFGESFVKDGVVTSNFDLQRNWAILRNLVARGNVGRIFVDPAIKGAFCRKAAVLDPKLSLTSRNEVLRRLRPYANHDDHFHLRIKCPTGHLKCIPQSEPPSGNGCAEVTGLQLGSSDSRTPAQIADDELGDDEG